MVHGIIAHLLPTLCPVAEAPADMVEQENCPSEPCQPQNCVYVRRGGWLFQVTKFWYGLLLSDQASPVSQL